MKRATLICTLLLLFATGCQQLPKEPPGTKPSFTERTFQRREIDGEQMLTVRVSATRLVSPQMLDILERELTISRLDKQPSQELAFWTDTPMALDPNRAELQVELFPANARLNSKRWIWSWPDLFQISRPGVLEQRPGSHPGEMPPRDDKPDEVGMIVLALHGSQHTVRGRLLCGGVPVPHLRVVAAGIGGSTDSTGTFEIEGEFPHVPGTLFVAYTGQVQLGGTASPTAPLEIFDDFHSTRNDRIDVTPTTTGEVSDFGDVILPGTDCVLWGRGVRVLRHFFSVTSSPPPAGGLRVKRWSAVYGAAGAAAHTFYNYIVAPTDLTTLDTNGRTFFHEFGHSIRHVADGAQPHWDWDNFRFIYARVHGGDQTTNKAFVFNEGWGNYWSAVVLGVGVSIHPAAPAGPGFVDFNEDRVGARLMTLAGPVGHRFMVDVLRNNPGVIHTLQQFEERYCVAVGSGINPFCASGRPTRSVSACPPGFNDDGFTCRLINIVGKRAFGRDVGSIPDSCGPDKEYDAGLCYPRCRDGFDGVGPVCWQNCPPDHHDDGAFCRRDAWIFGSNNEACPWYDKCGLTFARGCSVCPSGFNNDGCTCRRDPNIFAKSSYGRDVGTIPSGCRAGLQYDAGLCYIPCPSGTNGVGPVCWGSCPAGFADHGATCYRDPNIFSDDPVMPP